MSKMADLAIDVEDMLFEGYSYPEIAEKLNLSVAQVEAFVAEMEAMDITFDEPDDAYSDAEALASAGFGMDEDYGYAGEDY